MEHSTLDLNANVGNAPPLSDAGSIEDIIARGAATAVETEPGTAPGSGSDLEISEPRKRRKYTRRNSKIAEPTPEELAQQQAAKELEAFFAPEGIGAVFTTLINAAYQSLGAAPLTEQEQPMLASAFSQWAKYRLPASASRYQPDILLVATVGMTLVPRISPIAKTTAPWWRRMWDTLRRRKSRGE